MADIKSAYRKKSLQYHPGKKLCLLKNGLDKLFIFISDKNVGKPRYVLEQHKNMLEKIQDAYNKLITQEEEFEKRNPTKK